MKTLNSQQEKVVNTLLKEYLLCKKNNTTKIIRLSGKAGVGKTFCISTALSQLINTFNPERIAITCLAHKALDNFKESLKDNFPQYGAYEDAGIIQFRTIASLLRKFPIGVNRFSSANNESVKDFDLIIVDEYSMVGDGDTESIVSGAKKGSLIVFLGDKCQLSPVMASVSEITKLGEVGGEVYGKRVSCLELTQQMRNPGTIGQLADECRENIIYPTMENTKGNNSIVVHRDVDSLVNTVIEYIRKYGTEKVCLFNYTNKACFELGEKIRQALYPSTDVLFQGEIVTVTKGDRVLRTGDVLKVDIRSRRVVRKLDIITVYSSKHGGMIDVVHKKQQERLNRFITSLENAVLGAENQSKKDVYSRMLDSYTSIVVVSYQYCSTIHSSQGRTIPYCFVNTEDIQKCRANKRNLLYVAYSRASKELHSVSVSK